MLICLFAVCFLVQSLEFTAALDMAQHVGRPSRSIAGHLLIETEEVFITKA